MPQKKQGGIKQAPPQDGSLPFVNTWDIPELMDGARANANNVDREMFFERCKDVWESDRIDERRHDRTLKKAALTEQEGQIETLRAMFPILDAGLIRSMFFERGSVEECVEDLMALSAGLENEGLNAESGEDKKELDLKPLVDIDNMADFPTLSVTAPPAEDDLEDDWVKVPSSPKKREKGIWNKEC